jgi:anaerobic selenocysteine-containing dehydrogenase
MPSALRGCLRAADGRAIKVEADPNHRFSRGRLCARGPLLIDHLYHPERLNYPLKRCGERGANQWQRISWDQAPDEGAGRLASLRDRHGPETLAFTHGTHRTYHWDGRRFFNLSGSPNLCGANNVCFCPTNAVEWNTLLTEGWPIATCSGRSASCCGAFSRAKRLDPGFPRDRGCEEEWRQARG